MVKFIWTPSAVNDLEEICDFIAEDSADYAAMFARKIIDAIETIPSFPFSGKVVPEMKTENIRE